MKKFKVSIFQEAIDDIEDAVDFISIDSVANATQWKDQIIEKIKGLGSLPYRCPVAREESLYFDFEVRQLITNGYRILFRIKDDSVQVIQVKHCKRDYPVKI